jgi:hypothetical protein
MVEGFDKEVGTREEVLVMSAYRTAKGKTYDDLMEEEYEKDERKERRVKAVGTRYEVFTGKADHTSGGLMEDDLMKNKRGRIVSKKKHKLAKKQKHLGACLSSYGCKNGK